MRALRRQSRDLEGRRERVQDAYLAGVFSVAERRGRQHQLDEAKVAVLREMDLCENRGERLRKLVAYRNLLGKRTDAWNSLLEEHADLLKYAVEDSSMPWETDPFAQARRQAGAGERRSRRTARALRGP